MSREIATLNQFKADLTALSNLLDISKLKGKTVEEVTTQAKRQLCMLGEYVYAHLKDARDIAGTGNNILKIIDEGIKSVNPVNSTNYLALDEVWCDIKDNKCDEATSLGFTYLCWAKGLTHMIGPGAAEQRKKFASIKAQIHSKFDQRLQKIAGEEKIVACEMQSVNAVIAQESMAYKKAEYERDEVARHIDYLRNEIVSFGEAFVEDAHSAIRKAQSFIEKSDASDKKRIENKEAEHLAEIVKQTSDEVIIKLLSLCRDKEDKLKHAQEQFKLHRENMLSLQMEKIALEKKLEHAGVSCEEEKLSNSELTKVSANITELEMMLSNAQGEEKSLAKQLQDLRTTLKEHEKTIPALDRIESRAGNLLFRWRKDSVKKLATPDEKIAIENECLQTCEYSLSCLQELESKTSEDNDGGHKDYFLYKEEERSIEGELEKLIKDKIGKEKSLTEKVKSKFRCECDLLCLERELARIAIESQQNNSQGALKRVKTDSMAKGFATITGDWPDAEEQVDSLTSANDEVVEIKRKKPRRAEIIESSLPTTWTKKVCADKQVEYGGLEDFLKSEQSRLISDIGTYERDIRLAKDDFKNCQKKIQKTEENLQQVRAKKQKYLADERERLEKSHKEHKDNTATLVKLKRREEFRQQESEKIKALENYNEDIDQIKGRLRQAQFDLIVLLREEVKALEKQCADSEKLSQELSVDITDIKHIKIPEVNKLRDDFEIKLFESNKRLCNIEKTLSDNISKQQEKSAELIDRQEKIRELTQLRNEFEVSFSAILDTLALTNSVFELDDPLSDDLMPGKFQALHIKIVSVLIAFAQHHTDLTIHGEIWYALNRLKAARSALVVLRADQGYLEILKDMRKQLLTLHKAAADQPDLSNLIKRLGTEISLLIREPLFSSLLVKSELSPSANYPDFKSHARSIVGDNVDSHPLSAKNQECHEIDRDPAIAGKKLFTANVVKVNKATIVTTSEQPVSPCYFSGLSLATLWTWFSCFIDSIQKITGLRTKAKSAFFPEIELVAKASNEVVDSKGALPGSRFTIS